MQPQLREISSMAKPANSESVSIVFERTQHCQGSFNEAKARYEVIARISSLGPDYYEQYTVLVGDSARFFQTPFTWKPYDSRQKGLGFVLGETTDGRVSFPARCFSLKPPAHIDIEEMWHLLNDRRMSAQPKLIPVPPAPKEEVMSIPTDINPLALGLVKFRLHEKRLSESSVRCEALQAEIAELEARPTLEELVAKRLKDNGL